MAAPHSTDPAGFLMQHVSTQSASIAYYTLDGAGVWLKRAHAGHHPLRYGLLGVVARLSRVPALKPVRNHGGRIAIAVELQRLHTLAAHGVRVPEVLAQCADGFLMRDAGGGAQAAPSLSKEMQAAVELGSDAVLSLWRQGLATLDDVHARGAYLSQAFARNMVRADDGTLVCIDIEDDPGAVLPLVLCQVRDALAYLQSTAGYLHAGGAREPARRIWRDWLQQPLRGDAFRDAMQHSLSHLSWLRYLPPDTRWGRTAYRLRAAYEQAVSLRYE